MAGDWIAIRTDLHGDPAVLGISSQTQLDEHAVVGRLVRLWSWAQAQTADGLLPHATVEWINRYLAHPGFAEAMLAVGWLGSRNGVIQIPKFQRWMGNSAKVRLRNTRRAFVARLSRSQRDKSVTKARPEERRGEKSKEEKSKEGFSSGEGEKGNEGLFPILPDEPARKTPTKKPREPDPIWDAVVELTGADPKVSASHIGKVVKAIKLADPPYTPEEILRLPDVLTAAGMSCPITLGVVEKYLGNTRHPARQANGTLDRNQAATPAEIIARIRHDEKCKCQDGSTSGQPDTAPPSA